jgi:hypothetical protein
MTVLRWLFVVGILALGAHAALAATPTITTVTNVNVGAFSSKVLSLTTTHAPSILIVTSGTQKPASSTPTVSTVVDSGSAGLTFQKYGAIARQNSTCNGGATSPCSTNGEIWWATVNSNVTSESVTVTLSGVPNNFSIGWVEVYNLYSNSAPWDTNASLPVTNTGAASTVISFSGFSTSSKHDLLVSMALVNRNANFFIPCFLTFAGWGGALINMTQGNSISIEAVTQGVSTLQSAVGANLATTGSNCPAGNAPADPWGVLMTALAGDAPVSTSSTLLGTVPF